MCGPITHGVDYILARRHPPPQLVNVFLAVMQLGMPLPNPETCGLGDQHSAPISEAGRGNVLFGYIVVVIRHLSLTPQGMSYGSKSCHFGMVNHTPHSLC